MTVNVVPEELTAHVRHLSCPPPSPLHVPRDRNWPPVCNRRHEWNNFSKDDFGRLPKVDLHTQPRRAQVDDPRRPARNTRTRTCARVQSTRNTASERYRAAVVRTGTKANLSRPPHRAPYPCRCARGTRCNNNTGRERASDALAVPRDYLAGPGTPPYAARTRSDNVRPGLASAAVLETHSAPRRPHPTSTGSRTASLLVAPGQNIASMTPMVRRLSRAAEGFRCGAMDHSKTVFYPSTIGSAIGCCTGSYRVSTLCPAIPSLSPYNLVLNKIFSSLQRFPTVLTLMGMPRQAFDSYLKSFTRITLISFYKLPRYLIKNIITLTMA